MSYYEVSKTASLKGDVVIQGSKNSCLPMIAASVLHKGITIIRNCPRITDVDNMLSILRYIGCIVSFEKELVIDATNIKIDTIPREYVSKIRSSVVLLGALIGRIGEAKISYPGGCQIGLRKIDIHIQIFKQLGIEIDEQEEDISCKGIIKRDTEFTLKYASVGATENGILASVISDGYKVVLKNVAKEPEIVELCNCINAMGGHVLGGGTSEITITGVKKLNDASIDVSPDRIVAGTYLAAVTGVSGKVLLRNINKNYDQEILDTFAKLGARYQFSKEGLLVSCMNRSIISGDFLVSTAPYPGFPTDMQSQLMAVLCKRFENAIIVENVFENRLQTAVELMKMGANIQIISNRIALMNGVETLCGKEVDALDLRGGAALVIAGLMAENKTTVTHASYIKRGYQSIEEDLNGLGANIKYFDHSL